MVGAVDSFYKPAIQAIKDVLPPDEDFASVVRYVLQRLSLINRAFHWY